MQQADAALQKGDLSSAKCLYVRAVEHTDAADVVSLAELHVKLTLVQSQAGAWWDATLAGEQAVAWADRALAATRTSEPATQAAQRASLSWLKARLLFAAAAAEIGLLSVAESMMTAVAQIAPSAGQALSNSIGARLAAIADGSGVAQESARLERALGDNATMWVSIVREWERSAAGVAKLVDSGFLERAEARRFDGEQRSVLRQRALHRSLLFGAKKALQHAASRQPQGQAGGMGGGRYRCVEPAAMLRAGVAPVLQPHHTAALEADRYVVIDGAFSASAIEVAAAEVRRLVGAGVLTADPDDVCNPLQRATHLPLWDEADAERVRAASPALMGCVDALMSTPQTISSRLGVQLRVPQTVMVAAYPAGAYYRRHLDSYAGRDIPRLLTVLLYFAWEPREGGELRLHLADGPKTVAPVPGRMVVFWSREVEHEVLLSQGERLAATLWIWGVEKDDLGR